jgi:lipopolysaccharide transport system permease protein
MNPHAAQPSSVKAMVQSLWTNRGLIYQMANREVIGRYRGSAMGLLWSFLNPVFMLTVYTFFFAVVLKAKWGDGAGSDSKTQFAVILFVGMIVHSLFAEVISRAPTLILGNANYVKKVVFPIEILSVISVCAALFHSAISLVVLAIAFIIFNGYIHPTVLLLPLVFLPYVIFITGVAWMLASLGVYVRDLAQTINVFVTVLMFLSPVFYSISAVPVRLQQLIYLNPLTFIIEQSREVLIWGNWPNFLGLLVYTVLACGVASFGFFWFQKTRKGFADVL